MRRPTFTLVKPSPMGVVTGPLSATRVRFTESSSSTGSAVLWRSKATMPASWRSQSMATPATCRMRSTASVTSGPMPSPGINVIVWLIVSRTYSRVSQ